MSVKITREFVQSLDQEDLMKAISRNIFPTDLRLRTGAPKPQEQWKMTDSSNTISSPSEGVVDDGSIQEIMDAKCFKGNQKVYKHYSKETNCSMKFSIYLPDQSDADEKFHVVIFLSGIMCNEQNFLFKSMFQQYASEQKLIVVGADTSPRGFEFPGDRDAPIFGRSAGWYLDATEEPWSRNYRMYSYISKELPEIIKKNFPTTEKFGLIGHSMGGNGTVVIGLRNPTLFKCLSVLAPSCNPTSWGQDLIFKKFLGENEDLWKLYDASHVISKYDGPLREILLDQGADDQYLDFLLPNRLKTCAEDNPNNCVKVQLEMQEGYDHSYFFVASFIEKHLKYQKDVLDKVQ